MTVSLLVGLMIRSAPSMSRAMPRQSCPEELQEAGWIRVACGVTRPPKSFCCLISATGSWTNGANKPVPGSFERKCTT